jgi:hypothetical protein
VPSSNSTHLGTIPQVVESGAQIGVQVVGAVIDQQTQVTLGYYNTSQSFGVAAFGVQTGVQMVGTAMYILAL